MKKIIFSFLALSSIFISSNKIANADIIMPDQKGYSYCVKIKNIGNGLEIHQKSVRRFDGEIGGDSLVQEDGCLQNSYMTYDVSLYAKLNGKDLKVIGIDKNVLETLSYKHLIKKTDTLLTEEYTYRVGKITNDTVYLYKEKVIKSYSDSATKILFSTTKNPYMKIGYEKIGSPKYFKNYKNLIQVGEDYYGVKRIIK